MKIVFILLFNFFYQNLIQVKGKSAVSLRFACLTVGCTKPLTFPHVYLWMESMDCHYIVLSKTCWHVKELHSMSSVQLSPHTFSRHFLLSVYFVFIFWDFAVFIFLSCRHLHANKENEGNREFSVSVYSYFTYFLNEFTIFHVIKRGHKNPFLSTFEQILKALLIVFKLWLCRF